MKRRALISSLACLGSACLTRADDDVDAQILAATLVKTGEPAPEFTSRQTDGTTVKLSALRGKVVVLYFFAASAPASLRELAYLEKEVHEKLRTREDFAILAIGRGHSREEVVDLAGKSRVKFGAAPDPQSTIYNLYFSRFVPRLVVIGKDGTIRYIRSGYREFQGIVELQGVLSRELGNS